MRLASRARAVRLALIACLLCSPCLAAVVVQQPRPFGYVLGDTLTQRILLQAADHNFEPSLLPPNERAGLWFARRSARIELAGDRRRWLVLDYQVINAPQALMTVTLPALTLKARSGNEVLAVPEWPISIGPLTPRAVFAKGGLQELRPDHPAPMLPTGTLRLQRQIWLIAFGLVVGAWLAWWLLRSLRAAASQPFAQALREIRHGDGDDSPGAWLALHRAFDRTAQLSLQLSTLPALFQRAPHLEAEREAIERFYSESSRMFFSGAVPAGVSPQTLCKTLRRIERRNEQ
jgi:mxaA protein